GELARVPRGPGAIDAPVAVMAVSRYVVAASGRASTLYDLLGLRTLGDAPTFPRPAKSLATYDSTALVIDEAGATQVELTTGASAALEPPPGGSGGDVAGGATIAARDGTQFIVGGPRLTGGATARVVVITAEGRASFASLLAAREGACATWVEGR